MQVVFAIWNKILLFGLLLEKIGFMRLHCNALRGDSEVIFISHPERNDFHSANRSVVYRFGAA